jgi:hypothetical protein
MTMSIRIYGLKHHDGLSEVFVCRDCMTQIDPVGTDYPGYTKEQCDEAQCPLCGGHDTAWLAAPELGAASIPTEMVRVVSPDACDDCKAGRDVGHDHPECETLAARGEQIRY